MAKRNRAVSSNVEGAYFVDSTCINCGVSRHYAPGIFGDDGTYAFVENQPVTEQEHLAAKQALLACPVAAIGVRDKPDLETARNSFPLEIAWNVYLTGFNHRSSFGAHSYFVRDGDVNWMTDGPRFTRHLVSRFEEMGGLDYIFLTHKDDVGDAEKYARHFHAKRVIHEYDQSAQPDAEIILTGEGDHEIAGARILCTPGHTRGHLVMLIGNTYLFTGDHLAWSIARETFTAFRDYCWYDWDTQIESMKKLAALGGVQWIFPGHGKWAPVPEGGFSAVIGDVVEAMEAGRASRTFRG